MVNNPGYFRRVRIAHWGRIVDVIHRGLGDVVLRVGADSLLGFLCSDLIFIALACFSRDFLQTTDSWRWMTSVSRVQGFAVVARLFFACQLYP